MDLLLSAGQSVGEGITATSALASALGKGQLNSAVFASSVGRVLGLRAALAG
jgi:hypothetical protein